jgi:thiol-disulfide isomerase/thioredoxin
LRLQILFLLSLGLAACSSEKPSEDTQRIVGLPSISDLADSLSSHRVEAVKWAIHNDSIVYAKSFVINWEKEFEAIKEGDVNHSRYKDSYSVFDTLVGQIRTVRFTANSESQEVRSMEVRLVHGRIIYYFLEKNNQTAFSSSYLKFEFREGHYELELKQSIRWIFSSNQFVYGALIPEGKLWRGQLLLDSRSVPIQVIFNASKKKDPIFYVKNGEELVGFNQLSSEGDSLIFKSDHFNSYFKIALTSDSTMSGYWMNAKKEQTQKFSFSAVKNIPYRFEAFVSPSIDLSGVQTAIFYNEPSGRNDTALLRLHQTKHLLSGSFLTETGDYRYLDGIVRNDSMFLSAMDGTHVYYFEAAISPSRDLRGTFFAGLNYEQAWTASQHSGFKMRNPETITQLNDSIPFDFSFSDAFGHKTSLSDPRFLNKPVIVSIMGTWCSNCMDEAQFLKEVYETYHPYGLEIVALDFELITDSVRAIQNIKRHQENLELKYPILLASLGSTKQKATEKLPALSSIYSYPTMVVLDHHHNMVRIHTGFTGPATGEENYDAFRLEYLGLVRDLVAASHAP